MGRKALHQVPTKVDLVFFTTQECVIVVLRNLRESYVGARVNNVCYLYNYLRVHIITKIGLCKPQGLGKKTFPKVRRDTFRLTDKGQLPHLFIALYNSFYHCSLWFDNFAVASSICLAASSSLAGGQGSVQLG